MKVFIDTNIFLEYFEQRREYPSVGRLFNAIEEGKIKGVVSIGCVYTLAYLIRMELKRQGIFRPEQTLQLRSTLNTILSMVSAVGVTHKRLVQGVNDIDFDDLEDSFQYQSAIQSKFYDADNYVGKQCSVHIKLAPDGLLISATSAGGDPALCQAALTASRMAHIPKPPSQDVWAAVKDATITFKPGQ